MFKKIMCDKLNSLKQGLSSRRTELASLARFLQLSLAYLYTYMSCRFSHMFVSHFLFIISIVIFTYRPRPCVSAQKAKQERDGSQSKHRLPRNVHLIAQVELPQAKGHLSQCLCLSVSLSVCLSVCLSLSVPVAVYLCRSVSVSLFLCLSTIARH